MKPIRTMLSLVSAAYAAAGLAVVGGLGYVGYSVYSGSDDSAPKFPGDAAAVVRQAAERVADSLPIQDNPRTLLVLPIPGDRDDGAVRRVVADAIDRSGRFQAKDKTFAEKALSTLGDYQLGGGDKPVEDDEARAAARRVGADAVLVGNIESLRQTEPARLSMSWKALNAELDSPGILAAGTLDHASDAPDPAVIRAAAPARSGGPLSTGWSLLTWFAAVLLAPILLAGALSKVLSEESNALNGALLLLLTATAAALCLFLMGWRVDGWLDGLLVALATLSAGAYNYLVLDKLESLR